jgi:geranylgeranyl diphosphate synthase type I
LIKNLKLSVLKKIMAYINEEKFLYELNSFAEDITAYMEKIFEQKEKTIRNFPSQLCEDVYKTSIKFLHDFCVKRGGKRLRPFIMRVVAEGYGGSAELDVYASVELLHNFTLIHDDIMDRDDYRTGMQTVRKMWKEYLKGKVPDEELEHEADSRAINSGDHLTQLAYEVIANSKLEDRIKNKISSIFSRKLQEVVYGQQLDLLYEKNPKVTLEEVEYMYGNKTGALFEASVEAGGAIADAPAEIIYLITWARGPFNLRFQTQDDKSELDLGAKKGKPIGGDLKQGKVTPLFLKSLELADKNQKEILLEVWGNENASEEQIKEAIEVMKECGAVEYIEQKQEEWYKEGCELIEKSGITAEAQEILKDLTWFVGVRTY